MSGDENKAQDTRNMLNACNVVSRTLNSALNLIHHKGHGEAAKSRARGSSAWKASLDTSIHVQNDDGKIEISCTKMKDYEEPSNLYGHLSSVALGWFDEDGDEINGAIFMLDEDQDRKPVVKDKKESDHQKDIRKFTNAWFYGGAEIFNNLPYLSKTMLINYLMSNEGLSESTAKTYAQASQKGRLIYNLLNSQIILAHENGWIVENQVISSSRLIQKNER
jgi:hypothetical protein